MTEKKIKTAAKETKKGKKLTGKKAEALKLQNLRSLRTLRTLRTI